jgi:hypothetical protein
MTKKVKDIYFKEGLQLPIFVLQNGETKAPYQMGNTFIWLTSKEHAEFNKQLNEVATKAEIEKKPWYKKLFK